MYQQIGVEQIMSEKYFNFVKNHRGFNPTAVRGLLVDAGYDYDLMIADGFKVDYSSEHSILSQAYSFNEVRGEAAADF